MTYLNIIGYAKLLSWLDIVVGKNGNQGLSEIALIHKGHLHTAVRFTRMIL